MDIKKEIEKKEDWMIQIRRRMHRHPELSGQEEKTTEMICQELERAEIPYVNVPKGGVLGFIDGAEPGKTVLLRADIDALPIQESENNLKGLKTCVSEIKGISHACGHDAHTAMILAVGQVLQENRGEWKGRVILMFERGEEGTGNACYLYKYIHDHQISIDSCYGQHVYAFLESGMVSVQPGSVMAGTLQRVFRIKGESGHASRPDQARNPADCFGTIYDAVSSLRMRCLSPYHTFTSAIPSIHTNTQPGSYNIIPDSVEFAVVARLTEQEDGQLFAKELEQIVEQSCQMYGCSWELVHSFGPTFPVRNDPLCAKMAWQAIADAIGPDHMKNAGLWMASESMARHLALWPGVFALVGINNPSKGTGANHHNDQFDVDEDAMKYGGAAAVAYALGFLKSDLDPSKSIYKWKGSIQDLIRANNAPLYTKIITEIMGE